MAALFELNDYVLELNDGRVPAEREERMGSAPAT
jgi:hypothetical protein